MAEKIHQRIGRIEASDTIEELIQFHIGRCHSLKGARKWQYAMEFSPSISSCIRKKGTEIQIAIIMEITDYH